MPTTALMATEDSVLTATEVTVPDTALFLPLAPPLLLEPTSPTATLPPATTGPTLLEPSILPRGPLILTTDTATDMPAPSPLESPLSLMLDSPSRATLRATATATMAMVTSHHICSSLTRLYNHLNGT